MQSRRSSHLHEIPRPASLRAYDSFSLTAPDVIHQPHRSHAPNSTRLAPVNKYDHASTRPRQQDLARSLHRHQALTSSTQNQRSARIAQNVNALIMRDLLPENILP